MTSRLRTFLPALAAALLLTACDREEVSASQAASATVALATAASERTLSRSQDELLDIAFKSASSLPLDPHQKTRARLQDEVVAACLQLEQPTRAAACIEQIRNWRRGTGHADLACYHIRHGDPAAASALLRLAEQEAVEAGRDPNAQDWPQQRIRAGIARASLLLGDAAAAAKNTAGLPDFELGGVERVRVAQLDAAAFDAEAGTLQQVLDTGSFDAVRGALDSCLQLFDTFYTDATRRTRMQQQLLHAYAKLPADVRIELLLQAADAALRHDDKANARELLGAARQHFRAQTWLAENEVPMTARLGALWHRAGDLVAGRSEVDAAFSRYLDQSQRIVDIYRAGALRPVAEAYLTLGDTDAALSVYKRAVEAGVVNPNSRPRAEDLVATCCSLAVHQVEPDAALRARIRQVSDGLGAPW